MTKNTNRIETIIRKLSHYRTELVAKGYRKLAGYPENGFPSEEAYNKFKTNHKDDDYFGYFIRALIQIRKDLALYIDTPNFYDIFKELYLYGKVSKNTIENTNSTGCEWLPITDGSLESNKNKLSEGLYIKISKNTDLVHLKKFVTNGAILFNGYKQLIWGKESYKRIRISTFAIRNKRIASLSKLTRNQLTRLGGGGSNYKSIQIQNIIENEGIIPKKVAWI